MTRAHLSTNGQNRKCGPIPTSYTERASCAPSCVLSGAGGCYADAGVHTRLAWDRVSDGRIGDDWSAFCAKVSGLARFQLWRHNVAGDLPHQEGRIDPVRLGELVRANLGRRGFTFSHHDPAIGDNARWIKAANDWGFTINLSADTPARADELADLGIAPVVTIVPRGAVPARTPAGRRIVQCPAESHGRTCASCELCANRGRTTIVAFTAHGPRAAAVERVIQLHRRT